MSPADPKSPPRVKDPEALRRAHADLAECAACGERATNVHHVIQRGSPHFGDDIPENFVGICGSGTQRCHGALHGSPYVVQVGNWVLDVERRDAEWVGRRIGEHLVSERPDVIAYVLRKMGDDAGREFLRRFYYIDELPVRAGRQRGGPT